ncbi:sugar kinase [Alphaproteobacteria bacterium KMM 3653]|uniref:Sugar kinase n=1 Tax=Harenicola maris TaxID=2841044 RepID=A0AAP2CNL4_9RHOB|nr:sugar kinase [Harenicola maris]
MADSTPTNPFITRGGAPGRFTAIGECMVEMAPAGSSGQFQMGFAGDTYNTAWYLKQIRPEWALRYVTRVGTDAASGAMLAQMSEAKIETHHIGQSAERSVGLYLISLNDGERSFSYWRDQSAARQLADDPAALAASVADSDVIYFSGITLGILTPKARETLLETLAAARAAGKTTAFDSNLRPRLWGSETEMCDAVMHAAAVSDIVLPSYDDEASYFGDESIDATRDRYLKVGATTVVVKNGPGTVHYAHNGKLGEVSPPPVGEVVDTTAAGDSFNAGFFAGIAGAAPIEAAITLGCQVSGQVIGQRGALVPLDHDKLAKKPA